MIDLDHSSSLPGSPEPAPLQPMSPDRINQQREAAMYASMESEHCRDSDVHDKIRQFNNMAHTGASMSRQLERKTADAALKRAMLGREEAESEMRRYRDEARALRQQVEESRGRERKVGERLEDVMVSITAPRPRSRDAGVTNRTLYRKSMAKQRKLFNTAKQYGRRKFDKHARRFSRHSHPSSKYKRNSNRYEPLASLRRNR